MKSSIPELGLKCHYLTRTMKSYHFCAVFILINCPPVSIRWVRKLEVCGPFITIYVALSGNSAHFSCIPEINLQPVFTPVSSFRAPSVSPFTMESTVERLILITIFRGSCHLTVRNNRFIWSSDRVDPAAFRSWKSEMLYITESLLRK